MNDLNNNGGPAFPNFTYSGSYSSMVPEGGMTLRDYFAAKAMQTLLSNGETSIETDCKTAYAIADAMLKARDLTNNPK